MTMKIVKAAVCTCLLGLGACGGEAETDAGGYEAVQPSAAEPTATTAPPAEMEPDTIGMGGGTAGDTLMR